MNRVSKLALLALLIVAYLLVSRQFASNNQVNIVLKERPETSSRTLNDSALVREILKAHDFYLRLERSEKKIFSQNKEDGVILELINQISGVPGLNKKYVEFGTENGAQCNTRYIREEKGWTGLLLDGSNHNLAINLHQEKITHDNILDLFAKYGITNDTIDILSEDTDYGDFWIVEKILTKYRPKVIVHEVNQQPPHLCVTVPKPEKITFWDGSDFHGGSVCAFYCLAKAFQYTMVYCESAGVNCFWIRDDILSEHLKLDVAITQAVLNPSFLYKKPAFVYRTTRNVWHKIAC